MACYPCCGELSPCPCEECEPWDVTNATAVFTAGTLTDCCSVLSGVSLGGIPGNPCEWLLDGVVTVEGDGNYKVSVVLIYQSLPGYWVLSFGIIPNAPDVNPGSCPGGTFELTSAAFSCETGGVFDIPLFSTGDCTLDKVTVTITGAIPCEPTVGFRMSPYDSFVSSTPTRSGGDCKGCRGEVV